MSELSEELIRKKCKPCEGGVTPLTPTQIEHIAEGVEGLGVHGGMVQKTFSSRTTTRPWRS